MAAGRMLKSSIRTSKTVNSLSDFQFRLWAYLITYVDDYGRGSADPELLKGLVFPRRGGVTQKQIEDALTVLANTGMISLYKVDGESYLYFPKWGDHQRIRNKFPEYPAPPENDHSQQSAADRGESPIEVEVEVEVEDEVEVEVEDEVTCAESQSAPVLTLPLNDGSEYPISQDYVDQMQELYPSVDVMQELRSMKAWCINNPKRRKTSRGITAFIGNWLAKEQNRSTVSRGGQRQSSTFADAYQRRKDRDG